MPATYRAFARKFWIALRISSSIVGVVELCLSRYLRSRSMISDLRMSMRFRDVGSKYMYHSCSVGTGMMMLRASLTFGIEISSSVDTVDVLALCIRSCVCGFDREGRSLQDWVFDLVDFCARWGEGSFQVILYWATEKSFKAKESRVNLRSL